MLVSASFPEVVFRTDLLSAVYAVKAPVKIVEIILNYADWPETLGMNIHDLHGE